MRQRAQVQALLRAAPSLTAARDIMDDEIPLDANGPAYTLRQERESVPLA